MVRLLKNDYYKLLHNLKQIHPSRRLIVMITINLTEGIYPCQAKIKKIASAIFLYYAGG
jgi:hypothetical protein